MSNLSRRKFLATASATTAASIFLKSCVGNPPDASAPASPTAGAASPVAAAGGPTPEVTTIKLGYIPIVESAPLIIAKEKGFFAKHGMPDVAVEKQANWGAARDNVKIGSAGGGVDGGQWQMPMPYQITEGIITDGTKVPMYVLAQLNTQGNGIAIAGKHKGKNIGVKLEGQKAFFDGLKSGGTRFKAAYTFPQANQEFWIRYWLAAGGIDPDADVELLTVPAAQTVADMKRGAMDAFSTGDPWPYRIVSDQVGFLAALTAEMWKAHPEEYLAVRADWADAHPIATKQLLKAVMEAQQWCDDFNNRDEMATILSAREYFGLPKEILINPLMGTYDMGDGRKVDDRSMSVLYWKDDRGSVSYPYKSHDLWFITESVRWGFMDKAMLDNARALIDRVNREDLWREAAQELGVASADIPSNPSRGVETFFDGVTFDPENPQAYLNSLKIKRA